MIEAWQVLLQTGMRTNDWINSLERAVEICRDQVSLARAAGADKIAVPVSSLEKILDALKDKMKLNNDPENPEVLDNVLHIPFPRLIRTISVRDQSGKELRIAAIESQEDALGVYAISVVVEVQRDG